jgi:DNA replication protein DnaC
MTGSEPQRLTGLPSSLQGRAASLPADPFAAPTRSSQVRPSGPTRPAVQDAADVTPMPATDARFPCPCPCGCGNETTLAAATARGSAAAARMRCPACTRQGHVPTVNAAVADVGRRVQVFEPQPEDPLFVERDRQILHEEAEQRQAQASQAWRASLPEKFRAAGDEPPHPQITERLERMRSGQGRHATSMLCVGPYGSGKTWLAYAYASRLVDEGHLLPQQIVHGTEVTVLEPIAYAPYGQVNDRTRALLNRRVRMILLDDVGRMAFYPRQDVQHGLFARIVNFAYENNLILAMTTTLALGENGKLEEWIGSTAYERLRYMAGRAVVVDTATRRADVTAQAEREYAESRAARAQD